MLRQATFLSHFNCCYKIYQWEHHTFYSMQKRDLGKGSEFRWVTDESLCVTIGEEIFLLPECLKLRSEQSLGSRSQFYPSEMRWDVRQVLWNTCNFLTFTQCSNDGFKR